MAPPTAMKLASGSGSASLALEVAMDTQASAELSMEQGSPAKKLLAAFLSSPGKSPRGAAAKGMASPTRSPSAASLLLQNAVSRPASPVSRPASPVTRPASPRSMYSVASSNGQADEGPGFVLFEDEPTAEVPFELEMPVEVEADEIAPESEGNDKENVAPPRQRKGSKPTLEVPSPIESGPFKISKSHSTTDLPGAVGDVEPRKRPAGDDLSPPRAKQQRLL